MPRKRTHDEMVASEPPTEPPKATMLSKIQNMWEFACVMQFIFLFGKVLKIDDDFDIEDFENECMKPEQSHKLEEIGLQILKFISSFRSLDFDNWDEYVRRQYQSKAPNARHPYGEDDEPLRFRYFDVFTKIRVLHQLTVWTFWNQDRLRGMLPDYPKEADQTQWRIEPCGWDEDEREYYVLDDNRLYRRTEPPIPKAQTTKKKPKYTSKKAVAARRRASKRRKTEDTDEDTDMQEDTIMENEGTPARNSQQDDEDPAQIDTLGGYKWECIAITLSDYETFLASIKKTKDPNQKNLYQWVIDSIIPEIQKAQDRQQRKIEARQRELATMEKMATAKRSSRIADKHEKERRDAEAAEAERQRSHLLAAARKDEERAIKMQQDRASRMMTRDQRIREREYKRVLMEEQIAHDTEVQQRIEQGEARGSYRHLKDRVAKNMKELEELEEDEWTFDCSGCGKYGKNFDDGEHSVACERCNVWQHSKCLNIPKSAAEKDDFHFVCEDCQRAEEDAKRPKISLKFKMGQSSSPPQPETKFERFVGVAGPPVQAAADLNGRPRTVQEAPQPDHPNGHSATQAHHGPNGSGSTAENKTDSASIQLTPQHQRHTSNHAQINGHRIPSPIANKPTLSPTQGNHDVSPIAGIPGASPPPALQPYTNGFSNHETPRPGANAQPQITPHQSFSQSPPPSRQSQAPTYPISGLSPTKHRASPLPPPSSVPQKAGTPVATPQSSFNTSFHHREPSGTPLVLQPSQTFAPSPQQLNQQPVPTPSKHAMPMHTINDATRSPATVFSAPVVSDRMTNNVQAPTANTQIDAGVFTNATAGAGAGAGAVS